MGSTQKVDVRGDGRVVIYLRDGLKRPIWQARIRVPNSTGYKVVSTKTENQRDAERFALDLYEEIYMHVRAGGSIKSKTYRQVFDEWVDAISTLGSTRQGGSWIDKVDRVRAYSLDFFGNKKLIPSARATSLITGFGEKQTICGAHRPLARCDGKEQVYCPYSSLQWIKDTYRKYQKTNHLRQNLSADPPSHWMSGDR